MRFAGARSKEASMAWAICQGIEAWERVTPDLLREDLARSLGSSHDRDVAFDARCHEERDAVPDSHLDVQGWGNVNAYYPPSPTSWAPQARVEGMPGPSWGGIPDLIQG